MSSLTIRAERALIGALLDDTYRDLDLSYLRAEDFGHRVYRHVYTVINNLRVNEPELHGIQFVAAVAGRAAAPGIDAEFLLELRDTCPNAEHVTAYAAMIQAAAFRRDLAAHAVRITATVQQGADPQHRARLAAALNRQVELFATVTSSDNDPPTPSTDLPVADVPATGGGRAAREDQILADLLQHPEQALEIARFLPRETFTSTQRQGIYETILVLASAGDAVDEIIVAWEHARLKAYNQLVDTDRPTDEPVAGEPDEVYLSRLADTPIAIPSAIEAARDLLEDDTRIALSGRQTVASGRRQAADPQPVLQHDPALKPVVDPKLAHERRIRP